MRDPKSCVRLSCLVVVAGVAACAGPDDSVGSAVPGDRATSPAVAAAAAPRIEGDESMAALTAEVRQLRLAVEEFARTQAETQALSAYLAARQGRLMQTTQQLDAVRKEIDAVTASKEGIEEQLARYSDELPRSTGVQRAGLEMAIRADEAERSRLELELPRARARENELSRTLALEEDRFLRHRSGAWAQFQLSIFTSCGCGAPWPFSTSDFRLMRNSAHFVLQ